MASLGTFSQAFEGWLETPTRISSVSAGGGDSFIAWVETMEKTLAAALSREASSLSREAELKEKLVAQAAQIAARLGAVVDSTADLYRRNQALEAALLEAQALGVEKLEAAQVRVDRAEENVETRAKGFSIQLRDAADDAASAQRTAIATAQDAIAAEHRAHTALEKELASHRMTTLRLAQCRAELATSMREEAFVRKLNATLVSRAAQGQQHQQEGPVEQAAGWRGAVAAPAAAAKAAPGSHWRSVAVRHRKGQKRPGEQKQGQEGQQGKQRQMKYHDLMKALASLHLRDLIHTMMVHSSSRSGTNSIELAAFVDAVSAHVGESARPRAAILFHEFLRTQGNAESSKALDTRVVVGALSTLCAVNHDAVVHIIFPLFGNGKRNFLRLNEFEAFATAVISFKVGHAAVLLSGRVDDEVQHIGNNMKPEAHTSHVARMVKAISNRTFAGLENAFEFETSGRIRADEFEDWLAVVTGRGAEAE